MEERKLVDIEEVKDVLGDTINSEGDYHHTLRLLNGLSSVTEQEIVKPYLGKLKADIEAAYDELDGYDPDSLGTFASRIDDLIDNLLSESEGKE